MTDREELRQAVAAKWPLPEDVTYLNHGSFGPTPEPVLAARERFTRELARQPMRFFLRELEDHWDSAAESLGRFVGTSGRNLIFVPNATVGMNLIVRNVDLQPEDEVILTDHEYGSVTRMWKNRCRDAGAKLVIATLPDPITAAEAVVEAIAATITDRTRLLIVSHVTSATATILPVGEICDFARAHGVLTAIDGPHAIAMRDLSLQDLGCDYYTASCHKWLSAPLGSGFLFVHPQHQSGFAPLTTSWGGSVSARAPRWIDEFTWPGTYDPAPYLAIPAAIDFLETFGGRLPNGGGIEQFREHGHCLTKIARERLEAFTGLPARIPDSPDWYGPMISVPLPPFAEAERRKKKHPAARDPLANALAERYRIEVPVSSWGGHRLLRVSCHLYNTETDLDHLLMAIRELADEGFGFD